MPYKLLFILSSLALGLAVILIGLSFSMLWYLRISLTKFDAETIGKEAFICYGFGILLVTIYIIIFILFNL